MLPYIILCGVIIVFGALCYRKQQPNLTTAFFCVILILFSGLRGEFTADHANYSRLFEYVDKAFSFSEILRPEIEFSMEKTFVVLSRFIGCFTDSAVVYTLVISAITVGLFLRFFRKYSQMPWITILLFVSLGSYLATFNLVRQLLAVAIVLNAVPYLCDGRWKTYIVIVLAAAMIHRTALIMLPMGLVLTRRITKLNISLLLGAAVAVWFLMPNIITFVQTTIARYSATTYGMGEGTLNAAVPTLGIALFALYSISIGDCEFDVSTMENRVMINGMLLHLITLILGIRVYNVTRFAEYFEPYALVLTSNLIAGYRNGRERVIVIAAICFISVVFAYITISGTGYEPYYTIFS
ncbi:MAG: EpsG family protein [Oscillospiraceae bacterium]|nr:EpsG family protein [Oscillospiraceae bacterium]